MNYRFCPFCGHSLETVVMNDKVRKFCFACDKNLYRNPTVGVAVILFSQDKLLLVKRGRGISYENQWCIPCGHVEWGEEIREAGRREFLEETGLEIKVGPVFDVHSNFHDPGNLTVGIWFLGSCTGGKLMAGSDAQEARFFPLDAIPKKMAFPTDLLIIEKLKDSLKTKPLPTIRITR